MGFNLRYGLVAKDIAHIGVYLVEKSEPIFKALEIMNKRHVSSVIVEDFDDLSNYYILSERDIIRYFVENRVPLDFLGFVAGGREILQHSQVKDIMRGPIDIIKKETPIDEVIQIMNKKGFKRVIIGNERNQPIGVVSSKDIIHWTSKLLPKGSPLMIGVMEKNSGLVICEKIFKDVLNNDMLSLLGGSLSAFTSITSEIIEQSGNVRLIEKENFEIMLETIEDITFYLIVNISSISLRRQLQDFSTQFMKKFQNELSHRKKSHGLASINVFKIGSLSRIFE